MTTQLAARPFGPKRNHRRSGTRVIAFLGTGPMAANLARAGFVLDGHAIADEYWMTRLSGQRIVLGTNFHRSFNPPGVPLESIP